MSHKYILIPEYKPLYAMAKCFGPLQGPLTKPCLTPVDIIGQLLLQSGNEKLTIYETVFKDGKTCEPVLLTLENYKKPYEELIERPSTSSIIDSIIAERSEAKVATPTMVESVLDTSTDKTDPVVETTSEEIIEEETEESVEEHNKEQADVSVNPYAGLTKAERRRLRKEEAMKAASVQNDEQ